MSKNFWIKTCLSWSMAILSTYIVGWRVAHSWGDKYVVKVQPVHIWIRRIWKKNATHLTKLPAAHNSSLPRYNVYTSQTWDRSAMDTWDFAFPIPISYLLLCVARDVKALLLLALAPSIRHEKFKACKDLSAPSSSTASSSERPYHGLPPHHDLKEVYLLASTRNKARTMCWDKSLYLSCILDIPRYVNSS